MIEGQEPTSMRGAKWLVLALRFVVVLVLGGCMRYPGAVCEAPPSSVHEVRLQGGELCLRVAIYQPTDDERASLLAALNATCSVLYSRKFEESLAAGGGLKLRFPEGRDSPSVSRNDAVDVLERVRERLRSLDHIAFFVTRRVYRENAITMAQPPRVSLKPGRLRKWERADQRAEVVDTLAHELTHLLLCSKGDGCEVGSEQVVQDRGRDSDDTTFSYVFGWRAKAVFLEEPTPGAGGT